MGHRQDSITRKIAQNTLIAGGSALLLAVMAFLVYDLRSFEQTSLETLSGYAEIIGHNSASALVFNDQKAAEDILSGLRVEKDILKAAIYGKDSHLFAVYLAEPRAKVMPPLPPFLKATSPGNRYSGDHIVVVRDIVFRDQHLGWIYIEAELTELMNHAVLYTLISLVVLCVSGSLAWWISRKLQRRITVPLLELAKTAKVVSSNKDYSQRALKLSDDEIGALADTFNEMLGEIQRQDTDLRQARDELEQRVTERTQELEAFSYSVSHDLRAPLRAIHGFSQALMEDYGEQVTPEARRYLDKICAATHRMAELIDDLLTLSRISRADCVREQVDISEMANTIVEQFRIADPARRVDVMITPGMVAFSDPRFIKITLENLLGNAWKFTLHTPNARIEFGFFRREDVVVYYVRDNGAGFDMAHAKQLFAPFQRLHSEREFEGTGIGLATVHRIIQRHNGMIWVDSAVGRGATLYFTLAPASDVANLK